MMKRRLMKISINKFILFAAFGIHDRQGTINPVTSHGGLVVYQFMANDVREIPRKMIYY